MGSFSPKSNGKANLSVGQSLLPAILTVYQGKGGVYACVSGRIHCK